MINVSFKKLSNLNVTVSLAPNTLFLLKDVVLYISFDEQWIFSSGIAQKSVVSNEIYILDL